MSQLIQPRISLEEELSTLSAELIEAFMDADTQVDIQTDIHEVLKSYIKHVTRCGLCAGRSGLDELQDYFVQFQAILKNLLKSKPDKINQYRGVLEQWPLLVMSYMNSTDNSEFIEQIENLLNNTQWPNSGMAVTNKTDLNLIEQAENKTESYSNLYDGLLEEFSQVIEGLILLKINNAYHDYQQVKKMLVETATKLELFGLSAASSGLIGLMDVAQILQSGLRARSYQAELLTENEWQDIFELKIAIENYLKHDLNEDSVDKLIEAIRQYSKQEPMPAEEVNTLLNLLLLDESDDKKSTNEEELRGDNKEQVQPRPLSDQNAELLKLIAVEFENVMVELTESLQHICDENTDLKVREESTNKYASLLERFYSVAESIGLIGLQSFFRKLMDYFQQNQPAGMLTPEQQLWLAEWPAYVDNYLTDPFQFAMELFEHCRSHNSVLKLNDIEASDFRDALLNPQFVLDDEETEPRQTKAELSDVSLQLPDDVNQQLLDSLLQELPQQTADFSNAITSIISGEGSLRDVDIAQRIAHTLKGSANTVGVTGIATLTHHIEDILTAFTKQKELPQAPLTTTLQEAADILEIMSESLLGMNTLPEKQSLAVLQQVLDWANQIENNGLPESDSAIPVSSSSTEEQVNQTAVESDVKQTSLRITTPTIDEILRLVGESIILNGQLHESLRHIVLQNQIIQEQSTLFQQLAFDLEQVIDVRGINNYMSNASDSKFDALEMDQYNELHTLSRRLVEAATDSREMTQTADDDLKKLETLLHSQSRIEKDTQEVVMKTRMLPVQTIVPRLQRSVRQVCRQLQKEVDLELNGADTLIDSDLLNMLADPLMHILRNAVDHGIEDPATRAQQEKPKKGQLKLDFSQEGENINIRCEDDGNGLDLKAIKELAITKGLINSDSSLTDNELSRLILIAGFTTRDETTQISGRGIGMDAVYNQVMRMKGTLKIETSHGKGTTIEIQLPVTLITMHGIMVKVNRQDIALSNRGVTQILHYSAGNIREEEGEIYYDYEDETYSAFYVEDLLGVMRKKQDKSDLDHSALLLSGEDGKQYVVLVGKIATTKDLVLKKLGPYVPAITGVEGATILGGGSIAPVIDLPSVINAFKGTQYVPIIESRELSGIQSGAPKVLVVDDSMSARRTLAEFMHDVGYRVVTARDGMDAINQLEEEAPDVLLVDMEMPRMNGLEFTSYVRANHATRDLPVVMITSRATKKHRSEADIAGVNAYLVKPYSENELLDVVETQLKNVFYANKTVTKISE